ncbi:hypothetical protein SARC_18040, partial [Sphaeroforma arctica JP610]
ETEKLLLEEEQLQKRIDAGDESDEVAARINVIFEELHLRGSDSAESKVGLTTLYI